MVEDSFYRFLNIYKKTPFPIKYIFGKTYTLLPNILRYGNNYRKIINVISTVEKLSKADIDKYKIKKLNETLMHAKNKTLFYRNQLRNISLPILALDDFNSLIPFTTKKQIRTNHKDFVDHSKKNLIKFSTGGTTGEPLKIFYEKGVADQNLKNKIYFLLDRSPIKYSYLYCELMSF